MSIEDETYLIHKFIIITNMPQLQIISMNSSLTLQMSMKVKVWKRPLFKQGIMYKLVITTKKNKRRT